MPGDFYNGNDSLTKKDIASLNAFVKYDQCTENILEVESKKRKILYDQLRYIGKTIFDRAKLSVLKFYYHFLKEILKPETFELMETDTDSIYIALEKEKFEDNIAEDKKELFERLKHDYFITDQCHYGKRQPNRYKVECEGHFMISLCSKSYCVYNKQTKEVKFSSKGVQKSNFFNFDTKSENTNNSHDNNNSNNKDNETIGENIFNRFQNALSTSRNDIAKCGSAVNRGIKRQAQDMIVYEQRKNLFNSFYCKRLVLEDGIHTISLNL